MEAIPASNYPNFILVKTVYSTCDDMAWQAKSKARWDSTLEHQMKRIDKHAASINPGLDFYAFDIELKHLEANCALGKLLSPTVIDHIQQFTASITTLTQANEFASIVWGSIQAALKVCSDFSTINLSGTYAARSGCFYFHEHC
jgi:hypothetical protein